MTRLCALPSLTRLTGASLSSYGVGTVLHAAVQAKVSVMRIGDTEAAPDWSHAPRVCGLSWNVTDDTTVPPTPHPLPRLQKAFLYVLSTPRLLAALDYLLTHAPALRKVTIALGREARESHAAELAALTVRRTAVEFVVSGECAMLRHDADAWLNVRFRDSQL